jgi:hypothetical protein
VETVSRVRRDGSFDTLNFGRSRFGPRRLAEEKRRLRLLGPK